MTTDLLKAAKQWMVQSRYDHAIGLIIDYLEGMEAVTNSQPVAQETTCTCGRSTMHQVMHALSCPMSQETTTDAPSLVTNPCAHIWLHAGLWHVCNYESVSFDSADGTPRCRLHLPRVLAGSA